MLSCVGAVHIKIVFLLFFRLTGKKILFPCVHIRNISPPERLFWQAVRWENSERSQYSNWVAWTWRKMAQFCCIWTYQSLILGFMGVLQLLDTQRKHKTFFYQKNNCLKFLANRIIKELLLQCIEWLRNAFFHLLHRKIWSHSAGKMRSYEKIFPGLTEILVSYRQDLG